MSLGDADVFDHTVELGDVILVDALRARIDDSGLGGLATATAREIARGTRSYFEGNKRTARLIMTGKLVRHGFESVNGPFSRQYEFNVALDHLSKPTTPPR